MIDVEKLIENNATYNSLNAGRKLWHSDCVIDFTHIKLDDKYLASARVIGSTGNQYSASVKFSKGKMQEALCSCPYDWGGVCKHIVAVSLELNESIILKNKKTLIGKITTANQVNINGRKTSEPFDYPINDNTVQMMVDAKTYYEASNQVWHYDFNYFIENGILVISLVVNDYYYDDDNDENEHYIKISESKRKDHIAITSSPERSVKSGLSIEETIGMLFIERFTLQGIYKLLQPDFREKSLMEKAALYGIKDYETAQKYLELEFSRDGFNVKEKKSGFKLMKVGESDTTNIPFNIHELSEARLLTLGDKTKNNKQLFFYLQSDTRNNDYQLLSVVPFISKVKKNGGLYTGYANSVFDHPGYQEDVDLDENLNKLIDYSWSTIPRNFSRKFSTKIGKIEDSRQRKLFALSENLAQIKKIWVLLIKTENQICINPKSDNWSYEPQTQNLVTHVNIGSCPSLVFDLNYKNGIYELSPFFLIDEQKIAVNAVEINWVHPFLFQYRESVHLLNSVKDSYYLFDYLDGRNGFASMEENFDLFFEEVVKPVSKEYVVNIGILSDGITYEEIKPMTMKKTVFLKEMDKFILIRPFMLYDGLEINVLDGAGQLILDGGKIKSVERDLSAEKQLRDFLINAHPKFEEGSNQDFLSISLNQFIENYWFLDLMDNANKNDIEIYGFNDFKNFKYASQRAQVNLNSSSGEDWFDVEVTVTVGDMNVSLREVKKAILSKEKYIKLGNGKLAILPKEWIEKLEKYLRIGKVEKNTVKISKYGFNVLEEVFDEEQQAAILAEIREKKQKLLEFEKIKKVKLPKIDATLRDYQKQGYSWLHFLDQFGWGGILADDMGLGKTLQVITFIKSLVDKGIHTHLIVVPTSLLFNWEKEIGKFCPSLRYVIYHGSGREKITTSWKKKDLIITTYGVAMSDVDILKKVKFNYVILDESQAIKNPLSKRYKALTSLKAKNRLAMTGTPVENNTFDLYAQITFTNPGFFISTEHFKKTYSTPIDRDGDQLIAQELNKMINPFILRRTKELVATELPSKTEDVIYCQMETEQRKVYDAFRNKFRNDLLGMIEEQGIENSKLHILQALTKIRQICDSPALLNEDENYGDQSVKIKELLRHIQEKTGRHKILVFSQFVGMLSLIRTELDKNDVTYAYLDGRTTQKNRESAVNLFQDDESVRVFLISLKAGGTGLNLTAADYVYLVDPWWNPAVENQAIDRCYRIGQDKKVIAYRMICKDTIEEKIMNYKERKQSVADSIIKTDENIIKQLTQEDMMDLFA